MKVLIIDDDKTIGFFLGKILDDLNVEHVYKPCGECGLNEFMDGFENDNPFDVIFLDIYMPDYDGIQILQAIRDFEKENNLPKTCVIILTQSANVGIALTSKNFGAEKFIRKDSDVKQEIIKLMEGKGCLV